MPLQSLPLSSGFGSGTTSLPVSIGKASWPLPFGNSTFDTCAHTCTQECTHTCQPRNTRMWLQGRLWHMWCMPLKHRSAADKSKREKDTNESRVALIAWKAIMDYDCRAALQLFNCKGNAKVSPPSANAGSACASTSTNGNGG